MHTLFRDCDPVLLEKFKVYHKKNPELYKAMEKFALQAAKKRKRFSIWAIAQRVRWYTMIETSGIEFKVSNDYLALYARYIVYKNPELDGFFQFKRMKKVRSLPRE